MSTNQPALLATAIFAVAASVTIGAECVEIYSLKHHKREATFVFDGTVTGVERVGDSHEYAATMEVHRVWKGDMSKDMTVYFTLSSVGPTLSPGQRVVIIAKRQTAQDRERVDPSTPYRDAWVPGCIGASPVTDGLVKQLGRWRKPSERKDSRTGSGFVSEQPPTPLTHVDVFDGLTGFEPTRTNHGMIEKTQQNLIGHDPSLGVTAPNPCTTAGS